MPVKQLTPRQLSPTAQTLKDRLLAEWRNPNATAAQPIILEESGAANQPMHIYVVWDDWADLSGVERSEIIMSAFIDRYNVGQSLNVTVAMGLTPVEADRLGIRYK